MTTTDIATWLTGSHALRQTAWYRSLFVDPDHQTYPDRTWLARHDEQAYDVVNLGSSSARWAFDYESAGVRGMNWAQQPQTLQEDFGLLRHFHTILRPGAAVIIVIMPFTGVNKATGVRDALKYLHLDIDQSRDPIQPNLYIEARRAERWPIVLGKPALKGLLRHIVHREQMPVAPEGAMGDTNPMDEARLEADALGWVKGWMRQFDIDDLDAPLTPQNQQGRAFRTHLMQQLVDYCTEHGYRPIYVIPPVTRHLARHFTPAFIDTYITSFLRAVGRDVPRLDYTSDERLKDDGLFFNSFFLNRRGRTLFTRRVMDDIGL